MYEADGKHSNKPSHTIADADGECQSGNQYFCQRLKLYNSNQFPVRWFPLGLPPGVANHTHKARIEELIPKTLSRNITSRQLQIFMLVSHEMNLSQTNDIPEDGGFVWVEVSVLCSPVASRLINSLQGGPEGLYMDSGHSQRFMLLGPSSNSTKQTSWSCYHKSAGD